MADRTGWGRTDDPDPPGQNGHDTKTATDLTLAVGEAWPTAMMLGAIIDT